MVADSVGKQSDTDRNRRREEHKRVKLETLMEGRQLLKDLGENATDDTRRYAQRRSDEIYWQTIGQELDAQMKMHKMDFDEVVGTMERYANFRDTFGPK